MPRLRKWFVSLSLARKLTAIGVVSSGASLALACLVIGALDSGSMHVRLIRDTALLANVVGTNSTAAIAFDDRESASKMIRSVALNDRIVGGTILLPDGTVFAT